MGTAIERFETRWHEAAHAAAAAAVRRHLEAFYDAFLTLRPDLRRLRTALVDLLAFLATEAGRTDANLRTVDAFVCLLTAERNGLLERLPAAYQEVIDTIGLDLHEGVTHPDAAENPEATPEILLDKARALRT